jgi:hypothetical protein
MAAGEYFSLGLKSNGCVVGWGRNSSRECDVPDPNTEFIDVSAGKNFGLVLKGEPLTAIKISGPPPWHGVIFPQNYPNPFNPYTTIAFTLPRAAYVRVSVFDVEGKLVTTLVNAIRDEGPNEITWDGTDDRGNPVHSGVYFCRLQAGKKMLTKKMVMIK